MDRNCPSCGQAAMISDLYCRGCGAVIDATRNQSRTVISPVEFTRQQPRASTVTNPGCTSWPNAQPVTVGPRMRGRVEEHLVYAVDVSGSMDELYERGVTKLAAAVRAGRQLVLEKVRLASDDHVGVISFTDTAQVVAPLMPLRTGRQQLMDSLRSLVARGGTDINEALKLARDQFDWTAQVDRRILLLTDGHGGHPLRTADELKSRGVVLEVIGIGPSPSAVDERLLRNLSSCVDGESLYFFITDQATLIKTVTALAFQTTAVP